MADTEAKECKIATPEKKVVEEEKKEAVVKESPVKETPAEAEAESEPVEDNDEDSKASAENGDSKEAKENGSTEEKETDEKEVESTNGDSTDAPVDNDVCSIKRKSTTGGDVADDAAKDVTSPKKAKLDEQPEATAVKNGGGA